MSQNNGWEEILWIAAKVGSVGLILEIFQRTNTSPNVIETKTGDSALMIAVKNARLTVVEVLLNYGARVEYFDGNNQTAIHHAAIRGYSAILERLIIASKKETDALLDAQDYQGRTALHYAMINKRPETIEMLLAYGASKKIVSPTLGTSYYGELENYEQNSSSWFPSKEIEPKGIPNNERVNAEPLPQNVIQVFKMQERQIRPGYLERDTKPTRLKNPVIKEMVAVDTLPQTPVIKETSKRQRRLSFEQVPLRSGNSETNQRYTSPESPADSSSSASSSSMSTGVLDFTDEIEDIFDQGGSVFTPQKFTTTSSSQDYSNDIMTNEEIEKVLEDFYREYPDDRPVEGEKIKQGTKRLIEDGKGTLINAILRSCKSANKQKVQFLINAAPQLKNVRTGTGKTLPQYVASLGHDHLIPLVSK